MTDYKCSHCQRTVRDREINVTDLSLHNQGILNRPMTCPYCHNYSLEESA